jgi:transposase
MPEAKHSRAQRGLTPVHPAAAAIDIGATMHVAAVGADRDTEPVQTFQTFTEDLHRLADCFARCRVKTVVMESTGVYWNPDVRDLRAARLRGCVGQRPRRQTRTGAKNRCQ